MAADRRLIATDAPAATGFGDHLRTARERRGLTLRQIADTTKISVATLEALERDDPSKLPGGIFSRSFVRSFAAEVGLDPEDALREFERAFPQHAPRPDLVTPETVEPVRVESRRLWPWVVVAGLAVIGLAVVLLSQRGWRAPAAPATGAAPAAVERPAPAPSPPAATPGAGEQVAVPPVTAAAAPPPAAGPPPDSVPAPPGALRIVLEPRAECWVEVRGDGKLLVSRLMKPGDRAEAAADEVLELAVGDAGALAYTLNGQAGRSLGQPGQVVRVRIDRARLADFIVR